MIGGPWLAALAAVALLLGLVLMLTGRGMRRRRGLGGGRTVALDNVKLVSKRLGLISKPDRLVKAFRVIIPEEWKSAAKVWPNHLVQIGLDFVLIEEKWGIRPSHGFIVTGDGTRHRIENTAELRAWVLEVAEEIRRQPGRRRGLIWVHPDLARAARQDIQDALSDQFVPGLVDCQDLQLEELLSRGTHTLAASSS